MNTLEIINEITKKDNKETHTHMSLQQILINAIVRENYE